ncbi:ribonuclease Oy [Galendromus occidentalis]|uniref:Ribonuclease Oy n=1 Tax=Galendromus occidentalis TaxID=34638 RepID=A0AAJ6QU54_9ACAR|nr:ribonuclease Oy [Galendromus occidentalis]
MNQTTSTSSLEYRALPNREPSRGSYRWFAILCVIALLTASLHENVQIHQVSHDPNFEFLLFSQQTSSGYCLAHGHCKKSQLRPFFTIHGLWPSNATTWPESCNLTVKFDIKVLDPIRSDLNKYWPSVIGVNPEYFWSHEWHKHGSCAMSNPPLSGVLDYFNGTLNLLRTYNVSNFFLDSEIKPSETTAYKVSDVLKALKTDLTTNANIVCRKAEGYSYPVLTEVRFCLSKKTLEPIDCKIKHENCGDDSIFYIPIESVHNPRVQGLSRLVVNVFSFYFKYMSPV